ncbi:MAG: c-type cytochrome [Gammaproteobacteria bacterium]|nr:c-type cytochrome [Gammaproteobacteria bacterium]
MRSLAVVLFSLAVATAAQPAAAQHATPFDIESGERAYGNSCAVCHGPDGNLIADIDLLRGLYRRPLTDEEIVGIILNGIPNTPMPPTPGMSEEQARRIVAYLRASAEETGGTVMAGDARRGRELFFGRGECSDCHAVNGSGARHGPDLSAIGRERRAVEIEASLLDPAAIVLPAGRTYSVTLPNGEVVTGRLLNHDTFTVQLIDTDERLRSFSKNSLREHGFVETPMPAYGDRLTEQEIADLVSYLLSLQGQTL